MVGDVWLTYVHTYVVAAPVEALLWVAASSVAELALAVAVWLADVSRETTACRPQTRTLCICWRETTIALGSLTPH